MLPSFIRRRYDPDEIAVRPAYTPLENVDENDEFRSLVDEKEEDSTPQAGDLSFHIETLRRNGPRRVLKTLTLLVPSFLDSSRKEAKPLRSTAWLGNLNRADCFGSLD